MISKTYYKYIWLLDLLLHSEPLTYEAICNEWNSRFDGELPLRSFHEYRKGIKEMFGVDIMCNRSNGNTYYVANPEVIESNKLTKWLLYNYSIPQDFATFNGMKDRILLEEIPLGQAFLDSIIDAMQRNVELKIEYQCYERDKEEHMQMFHIQPYAMKVYNHRWYLLGYLKEHEGLRNIALDRILSLKVLNTKFELPADFDARRYYANVVGIFVNDDLPPQKVKIRVYGVQADYLRSTPLHKSQKETYYKRGEFSEFTYKLSITPELISQLLSMGSQVEVLEPEELREEMKERINNMSNLYK